MSEPTPLSPDSRGRLRQLYASWLPVAFGLAAIANLVLTFFLPIPALPIRIHEDGSLTHLVHTAQPTVNRRFSFYMELDDATDGGVLVVPIDSFVRPELAEGFADFEVVECDYDPGPLDEEVAGQTPLGEVQTESGNLPYFIVTGQGDVWWLAITDNAVVVVPESVIPPPCGSP